MTGVDRLSLRYGQKLAFAEVAGVFGKDCCDFLRKLNALRQKIAHELEYQLSEADTKHLREGFGALIPHLGPKFEFASVAAFLTGYLGGAVQDVRAARKRPRKKG